MWGGIWVARGGDAAVAGRSGRLLHFGVTTVFRSMSSCELCPAFSSGSALAPVLRLRHRCRERATRPFHRGADVHARQPRSAATRKTPTSWPQRTSNSRGRRPRIAWKHWRGCCSPESGTWLAEPVRISALQDREYVIAINKQSPVWLARLGFAYPSS